MTRIARSLDKKLDDRTRLDSGDSAALRLVVVSILISMAALMASEWFARRALLRLHGN